jgi:hypothetical protein
MMPKRTWLMAILGFFLAATLIWGVPVFAQLQKEGVPNNYNQSSGTGSSAGLGRSGMTKKSQSSWGDQFGWKNSDRVKNQALSKKKTNNHAKPRIWPQSQTPGGTIIP